MRRKLNRDTRQQLAAVTAAGGTVRWTKDGHAVFHDADGAVIGRSRTHRSKDGRASRSITQRMVAKAAAKAPTPPATPRVPAPQVDQLELLEPAATPAVAPPPPRPLPRPQEGQPMEKRILVCDLCDRTTGAVDSLKLESMVTGTRAKLDVCQHHLDGLLDASSPISRGRPAAVTLPDLEAPATNGHTRAARAANMRCPLPGDDGYEGAGQGLFQHVRHNHPDAEWGDTLKAAAKAAYELAHANGHARPVKVAS